MDAESANPSPAGPLAPGPSSPLATGPSSPLPAGPSSPLPAGPSSPPAAGRGSAGAPALRPAGAPERGALVRLGVPAAVLAAVAGAFAYVGSVDPYEPGHYPVCPLLRFTGIYCPGCGGLRSAHAFVHGDLPAALHANAPAVLGYLGFAVLWAFWVIRAARGRPVRIELGPVHLWTLGTLLLVFTVVRNLPFGGWLLP